MSDNSLCSTVFLLLVKKKDLFLNKFITFDQGTRIYWMELVLPSTRRPRPLQPAPLHSLTGSSNGRNTSLIHPHPLMLSLPQRSDILASPSTPQLSRHLINGNSVIKIKNKNCYKGFHLNVVILTVKSRRVYGKYGYVICTCQKYQN